MLVTMLSSGNLHMSDIRDCFVPLQHAFNMLIKNNAFLLTAEMNTVAIITRNKILTVYNDCLLI